MSEDGTSAEAGTAGTDAGAQEQQGTEWAPPSRAEVESMQKALAQMRREKTAAERVAQQADEARAAEQGKYKELFEQRDKDLKKLEARLQEGSRKETAASVAKRLNFNDPEDAHRFLSPEQMDDPVLAEAALRDIVKEKKYLVAQPEGRPRDLDKVLMDGKANELAPSGNGSDVGRMMDQYIRDRRSGIS